MKKYQPFLLIAIILIVLIFSGIIFWKKEKKTNNLENHSSKEIALPRAISFVSPHHLLAEKIIDDIFRKVSDIDNGSNIERIILISPNHFNAGHAPAIIPDASLAQDNVKINLDEEGIGKLSSSGILFESNNDSVRKEHGIMNLLPYAEKYFPNAKIVPLALRDGISDAKIDEISAILNENFKEKTIMILSADFSHYIGDTASQMHDQKSIETIAGLDSEKINKLDVDCQGGLRILLDWTKRLGYLKFNLLADSNSSEIIGHDAGSENTSYVTGYFSKEKKIKEEKTAHLLFLGDLMLDRYNRAILEKKGIGWPTEKIQRLFWSQDANIANLEGPITSQKSVSALSKKGEKQNLVFTFDPEEANGFLKGNSINIVNLGNNHTLNFGLDGLSQTKKYLEENQISFFGDPETDGYISQNINGYQINFVNYNQFGGAGYEKTLENIKKAKLAGGAVIVYCHWGNEYQLKESNDQKSKGHAFVDAGADAVIGSHPHVVQPIEIYKNKAIFYSLGDFFFDQYFSQDVRNLLSVGVVIGKNSTAFYLMPLYTEKNGQISISDESKKNQLLSRIAQDSTVDNSTRSDIMKAEFTIKN